MASERGLERLTFFTDAIVAIAITLLILPLVDDLADVGEATPQQWLSDHSFPMLAFVITFAVIARFWMSHHTLFLHIAAWTPLLRWLSMAWALTIVFLALPSAMLTAWDSNSVVAAVYIGTMLLNNLVELAMVLIVRRRELQDAASPVPPHVLRGTIFSTVEFALALGLSQIPEVNYWGLFALFLSTPLRPLLRWRDRRAEAARG
jgi:uncharacterized membrane protein